MNVIKLLLTLQLIFSLIPPPPPRLLGDKDVLSPRSEIQSDETLYESFTSLAKNPHTFTEVHAFNKVLEALEVSEKFLSRFDQTIESEKLKQLINTAPLLFMSGENGLEDIKTKLAYEPQTHEIIDIYETLTQRLGNRQNATIQNYLDYYSEVRNSATPFDLEPLDRFVSPEHIRQFIEKNIRSKKLSYLQLEFLFAEMIRRLKLDKNYSLFTWPRTTKSPLHETKIFKHIFSDLLADWQTIPALDKNRLKFTREEAMRRLSAFILLHLLGEKEIVGFTLKQQKIFLKMIGGEYYNQGYYISTIRGLPLPLIDYIYTDPDDYPGKKCPDDFSHADLRWINLSGSIALYCLSFKKADLRHSNLQAAKMCEPVFSEASLAEANLKSFSFFDDGYLCERDFESTDFTKADMTNACFKGIFNKANFKETILVNTRLQGDFTDVDFAEALLNETSFSAYFMNVDFRRALFLKVTFDHLDIESFTNCLITEEQYKNYFYSLPRDCFQIDPPNLSSLCLAPLFLLTGFDSQLLAVAATVGFFYALVKLATATPIATAPAKMQTSGSGTAVRIFLGEVRPFQSPFSALEASL